MLATPRGECPLCVLPVEYTVIRVKLPACLSAQQAEAVTAAGEPANESAPVASNIRRGALNMPATRRSRSKALTPNRVQKVVSHDNNFHVTIAEEKIQILVKYARFKYCSAWRHSCVLARVCGREAATDTSPRSRHSLETRAAQQLAFVTLQIKKAGT